MFSLSQLITVVNWTEDKCFSHRKVSVSHSLLISATFDVIVDTSITFFVLFFSRLLISSIFFSFISEKVLKDFLQPHLVLFDISCPCM